MIAHTPGPWFFHDGNVYAKKPALLPKLAERSVKIAGYDSKTVFTDKDLSIDEMHGNARLIAAAPELLEALKGIVGILTQPVQFTGIRNGASCDILRGDCASAVVRANGAIAKAEGKQV